VVNEGGKERGGNFSTKRCASEELDEEKQTSNTLSALTVGALVTRLLF
jgi:hypothetical protein